MEFKKHLRNILNKNSWDERSEKKYNAQEEANQQYHKEHFEKERKKYRRVEKKTMSHFSFGPSHKYVTFVQEVEKSVGIRTFTSKSKKNERFRFRYQKVLVRKCSRCLIIIVTKERKKTP